MQQFHIEPGMTIQRNDAMRNQGDFTDKDFNDLTGAVFQIVNFVGPEYVAIKLVHPGKSHYAIGKDFELRCSLITAEWFIAD